MKTAVCLSLLLLFSFLAEISYGHFTGKGHVHTLSESRQVFLNSDCLSTDSCDLKRFTLVTSVQETWFSDDPHHPTFGNSAIFEYETDSVAALENYAIVQFKRGCVFYSSRDGNGRIKRELGDIVLSFGEQVSFCFPRWVIDSQDEDPAYNSDPDRGRFHFLRWNGRGSHDHRTQKYYGAEKPQIPILYMADYPSGAFVTATGAKNVALEFNTCIFKAEDVPVRTRRDDLTFATPLACFEWQNVYVYDFDKAIFQTDLAYAPSWEEPAPSINVSLLVIFATLLVALAAVTLWALHRKGRS